EEVSRLERHAAALRDRAELAELADRCAKVERALAEQSAARVALEHNPVDEDRLEAVERAHRAVLVADATLTAGSPNLEVSALGGHTGQVRRVDDASRSVEDFAELVVDTETVVTVDGVVELRIRPPAEAAGLAAALERAKEAERTLLGEL